MATASEEDIKDAGTTQAARKKPCRVCRDFKTWTKIRIKEKVIIEQQSISMKNLPKSKLVHFTRIAVIRKKLTQGSVQLIENS